MRQPPPEYTRRGTDTRFSSGGFPKTVFSNHTAPAVRDATQVLKGVTDLASADAAAAEFPRALDRIQTLVAETVEKMHHLSFYGAQVFSQRYAEQLSAAEQAVMQGEKEKVSEQLKEADYYGSSALKSVMESLTDDEGVTGFKAEAEWKRE